MASSNYSEKDLEVIKNQLLAEKKKLTGELTGVAEEDPNVKGEYDAKFQDIGTEVDDSVQEVAQFQVSKSVEVTLEKRLRDLNNTLERIEKGDYGVCKYCDQPISIERLKARPTSSSCVSCKKTLKHEV